MNKDEIVTNINVVEFLLQKKTQIQFDTMSQNFFYDIYLYISLYNDQVNTFVRHTLSII